MKYLIVVFVLVELGCARVVPAKSAKEFDLSAPVQLYAPSAELRDLSINEIVTVSPPAEDVSMPITSDTIRTVAAKTSPAVVSIFTKTTSQYRFKLLPLPTSGIRFSMDGEALGSGFFIREDGYIITNHHVLTDAIEISVRTVDNTDYPASIVASDPVYDLALLKIDADSVTFPILPMGDSEAMEIGDWVVAVGNPLGLGHTVTHGIISQTGRTLESNLKPGERQIEFLQSDTPINSGSSGGPMVNLNGAWIGVNTAVVQGAQGISFCVPSVQVKAFLQNVIEGIGAAR